MVTELMIFKYILFLSLLILSVFFSSLSHARSQFTLPPSDGFAITESKQQPTKPKWCQKALALNQAEQIICFSPQLWSLEEKNIAVYSMLYRTERNQQELNAWLKYRNIYCTTVTNCTRLYKERLSVLEERKSIKAGIYQLALYADNIDYNRPSWCINKLNQSERFICEHANTWQFDSLLNKLYQQTNQQQKDKLMISNWRKNSRDKKCKISLSACIQSYHEKILHLHYLLWEIY